MDLNGKTVLAHKGFFSKEAQKSYKENSKEVCALASKKDYISHIEIDVRKSKEGIVYCYHGNFWQYYFLLKIPRSFSYLKNKYKVDTLREILEAIDESKIVVFDIKDRTITKEDVIGALGNKKFKDLVVGGITVSSLKRFGGLTKFFWGNIFSKFYNLNKLKEKNFKYFDVVFPWQISQNIVDKVERQGMQFGCFPMFFFNKKHYWNTIDKYNLKIGNSDFV